MASNNNNEEEKIRILLTLNNLQVEEIHYKNVQFARVWLTRFQARNALNNETLQDIVDSFTFLQTQFHLNVVVLGGKGKSFSAGADLKAKPRPTVLCNNGTFAPLTVARGKPRILAARSSAGSRAVARDSYRA